MKQLVFVLVGARKRVGKDTASDMLVCKLRDSGRYAEKMAFATALKFEVEGMFRLVGIPADAHTEDPVLKEKVVRPMLIAHGMARRYFDENYWIEKVIERAGGHNLQLDLRAIDPRTSESLKETDPSPKPDQYLFIVVSDWRFPNECLYLKQRGFPVVSVLIQRPGLANSIPEEIENEPKCHAIADHCVMNGGTKEDLDTQVGFLHNSIVRDYPAQG